MPTNRENNRKGNLKDLFKILRGISEEFIANNIIRIITEEARVRGI